MTYLDDSHREWHTIHGAYAVCPLDCGANEPHVSPTCDVPDCPGESVSYPDGTCYTVPCNDDERHAAMTDADMTTTCAIRFLRHCSRCGNVEPAFVGFRSVSVCCGAKVTNPDVHACDGAHTITCTACGCAADEQVYGRTPCCLATGVGRRIARPVAEWPF